MKKHDPRCEGTDDDEKILADVAEYGWHVVKILETDETPGWAFSIGLYQNFNHPEVIVFGLNADLMHFVINSIGDDVRSGKSYEVDCEYADLIDAYCCTFKVVNPVWYSHFLGYANWFYKNREYPVLQCIWPDRNSRYPWEPEFNPNWLWAQPLLFHADTDSARTVELLKSMKRE
jgi:hypothetical protein